MLLSSLTKDASIIPYLHYFAIPNTPPTFPHIQSKVKYSFSLKILRTIKNMTELNVIQQKQNIIVIDRPQLKRSAILLMSRLTFLSHQSNDHPIFTQLRQFLLQNSSSKMRRSNNHLLNTFSLFFVDKKTTFFNCLSLISYHYGQKNKFLSIMRYIHRETKINQSHMTYTMLFLLIIFLTSSEQASKMFHLHDQQPEPAPIDPFEFPEPAPRPPENPPPNEGIQLMYYEQYKKIYNTSFRLHGQAAKQVTKHTILSQKIAQMEAQLASFDRRKRSEEVEQITERTPEGYRKKDRKRNRRTAEEIVRRYECPHQYCDRCYGSDGSLQQHLKLKHPELYQKEEDEQDM